MVNFDSSVIGGHVPGFFVRAPPPLCLISALHAETCTSRAFKVRTAIEVTYGFKSQTDSSHIKSSIVRKQVLFGLLEESSH